MASRNKPIWVQVAEAGFGDRLAELGWKQVSPAHWRLDGDGVIWRTMLGPAPEKIRKTSCMRTPVRTGRITAN